MHPHKKRMILIFSVLATMVIGIFAADTYFNSREDQGLFDFVDFAAGAVRIGDCEVVIDAHGEVESATLLVRNIGGVISGGAPTVSSNDSAARYKITYAKGMKQPQEEQASATAAFSSTTTLQDLDFAVQALTELFPRTELQLQFFPGSSQSTKPDSYDDCYQYSFSGDLQKITAAGDHDGDELIVKVGGKTCLVIFRAASPDN